MDKFQEAVCSCVFLLLIQLSARVCGAEDAWNISCPIMCACDYRESAKYREYVKIVDCSNKKLTFMPPNIPLDTQVLFLKGNVIPSIQGHLQRLTQLREVDLSHNRVTSLGQLALFENLTSLRHLNLEGNQITTLHHGSFSGLKNLDDLFLSRNRIETIEEHAFGGLNHLQTLSLSHNKLANLKSEWFEGMGNLNALQLDNNQLADINDAIFSPLPRLSVLTLSRNWLHSLRKFAFQGLPDLQKLNLDENHLSEVPTMALSILRKLRILSLNGNPIRKISFRHLQDLPLLSDISLCRMSELEIVDKMAFYNLPSLHTLEMHHNEKLTYVDYNSLEKTPELKLLYLHNNKLMALPYEMVRSAPSLQVVSFHDNPVQCDCNVYWMAQLFSNTTNGTTSTTTPAITFQEPENIVCDAPPARFSTPLQEIPAAEVASTCRPTVISYFNDSYQVELGESVIYECRAIGVPEPHIHWILSNGKVLNNTSNFSRLKLESIGTLRMDHTKAMDAGTYTCTASNSIGYDKSHTVLRVHSKNIHILHKGVATNFITVTWNGTDATIQSSDYVILYRQHGADDDEYGKVYLRPYMRTYTITNLKPQTMYEFCIAYEHKEEQVKLNCMDIKTKSQMFVASGIKTLGNMTIIVALTITCTFIFVLCIGTIFVRRYRKRKLYEEPEGTNQVNQKVGTMSQIPLDNLYNPPSTPLCTSRTSLINSSQA